MNNMKKSLLLVCTLFLAGMAHAQMYSVLKPQIALPIKTDEIDWGAGSDLQLGYSITGNLDLEIGAGKLWFKTLWDSYQIQSIKASMRYYVTGNKAKPFIGFGAGYFQKNYKGPLDSAFKENAMGVVPSAGVLYDIESVKGLSLITELGLQYIHFNQSVSMVSLGAGLRYSFRQNQKPGVPSGGTS